MSGVPPIKVRGIRQTVPTGYMLGRISSGSGEVELIPLRDIAQSVGMVLINSIGPVAIQTTGSGISNTAGTLSVEWNAGTVNALGTGLGINSGTLNPNWRAGTIIALGTALVINSGTLNVVDADQWLAGTVTAIGTNLAINSGTLNVTSAPQEWTAGSVTAVGSNLAISSTTLEFTGTAPNGMLPLANGDLPGPALLADPYGQCIGVAL